MQSNKQNSNDMDNQTKLKQQEMMNRCYVVWNHRKKRSWEEEPMIIIYPKPNKETPFSKQRPEEILTKEQMERKYGVKIT